MEKFNETREIPLQFLVELNEFLQTNFPMKQVRDAVVHLENFIQPQEQK